MSSRRLISGGGRCGRATTRGAGFTLIEVMIVIAIVLALSTLVGIAVWARRDEAKRDTARIEMSSLRQALNLFRLDYDRWPTDEEGLAVLWDKSRLDPEADEKKWKEYLQAPMPNDKWGRPWGYRQVTEHMSDEGKYDLWSSGPDGQEGTEDDITSWEAAAAEEGGMDELPPPSPGPGSGGG